MATPGCQHSAGVLENGVLSETTYNKIIDDIKRSGEIGFGNVSLFPCAAKSLPAAPGLVPFDLENKEKYPDFHKNFMGTFEKIALALDVQGAYSLPPPLVDPFSIALGLDLDPPSFDLLDIPLLTPPDLALSLNIRIPDISLVLDFITAHLPQPPLIPLPPLPVLDPRINLPPNWAQKFEFDNWAIKLPELVISLAIPDINLILGFLKVPPDICPIIDKVSEAQLFGPTQSGDLTRIIATQELVTFTAQCATITIASLLVGDGGPAGVTGTLGTQYGFREAIEPVGNTFDINARRALIGAFKKKFKRTPTVKEVQFAQIIGKIENGYGTAWPGSIKKEVPPEALKSNNWGNIHGSGPAGKFKYIDYNADNVKYETDYAMFATQEEGAGRLLHEIYVRRPYILEALNKSDNLFNPIFLMSSQAVLGSAKKNNTGVPASDAIIPPDKGGRTYYEAPPRHYFTNAIAGLKGIAKHLSEDIEFNIDIDRFT